MGGQETRYLYDATQRVSCPNPGTCSFGRSLLNPPHFPDIQIAGPSAAPLSRATETVKAGYLLKKVGPEDTHWSNCWGLCWGFLQSQWKQSYFVLYNCQLFSYNFKTDTQPLGNPRRLDKRTRCTIQNDFQGRAGFFVILQTYGDEYDLVLSAENESQRDAWAGSFMQMIHYDEGLQNLGDDI